MRLLLYLIALTFGLFMLMTHTALADMMQTFMRQQCLAWLSAQPIHSLGRPKLVNASEIVLTKYKRMQSLQLDNQGGFELTYCDGFYFPSGLKVSLTLDGRSCEISGTPTQAQASTFAYVIAGNRSGRSLALVPISVNALVLRE